ncbi:MAG: hypothetical protein JRJ01_15615 [Deltaproteobacteria bacterium]|nr:hypothetical protein [Deltaproteobacteria bacterium]
MGKPVHDYTNIYEFAASAGSLEGFVYRRENLDATALSNWVDNLVTAYGLLPPEALEQIQPSIDQTVGRAVRSLVAHLEEDHGLVRKLKSMIKGEMPASADDFKKKKWFQE